MQCLYCGKGIGPIRQLRDLEFCSEAHRNQFRERYRQQVYEALAPDPAPGPVGDFIGQPPAVDGPAPCAALHVLSKAAPREIQPTLTAQAAGVYLESAGWSLGQAAVAMPVHPVWQASSAPFPPPVQTASFTIAVQPPSRSTAGAVRTQLASQKPPARRAVAAPRISESNGSLLYSVSLRAAIRALSPHRANLSSPQLRTVFPRHSEPVALESMAPTIRAAHTRPSSAAIAAPAPPAGQEPATDSLSPAAIATYPRPLEAGPLPMHGDWNATAVQPVPVAFEASGSRHNGIVLPKPPTATAHTWLAAVEPSQAAPHTSGAAVRIAPAVPDPFRAFVALAPRSRPADPQPAVLPAALPTWHTARTADAVSPLTPPVKAANLSLDCAATPSAAHAGFVQPDGSSLQEAAGNRDLRAAVEPAASHGDVPATRHEFTAQPGVLASAPPRAIEALQPAAPPAANPSWNTAPSVRADRLLLPSASAVVPPIRCVPAAAVAVAAPGRSSRSEVGRALRACAVLWTLRVARVFSPIFDVEPVRVQFNELLRGYRGYFRDADRSRPAKNNLRSFRRHTPEPSRKQKWQYIGAAAAALLLAGMLRPEMIHKSLAGSSPWTGMSIRQWMTSRATRNFEDDFRSGLNQWKGVQAQWPKNWSHSADGFIQPGQLALYRPSVPLSDYRFEFMAQVETKSVDWVVRAQDANNYYALKFTVLQPGPRPLVAMVRYPVIDGARGARVQTPLRMMVHANTPYRVTVDVKGNRYRAFVEGQEADFWTDDRLKTGGVGFFSEAGERARVYWVKLESHGDLLGRICGLLSGKGGEGTTDKEREAMDYRHAATTDAASALNGAETAGGAAQETRISRVLSKAASLHLDGKRDEAARELVRVLDGGERHPALFFALGQLQYELEEYLPAAQSYAQAALLQPLHPTAHFNAGVCQGRLERWDEAAESFKRAIANDPSRVEAHLALGACLVQLGRHNEALDAYDRFLARHPDHDEALFGKAVALQKRDRTSEAVDLYRRILNRNPNSEEALSNLVSLSLANQDYEQVRKYAQRLADVQPKSQIALEGLAGAAFAAGDHMAAAAYSRKLAELAPQVFENWFNLGVACHKAGDLANAADAYARATRVQPDSPQAHLNLGVALQEQGDLKGARAAYERALEIDPKLAGVHWNLGLVHEQLGDPEAAEKLYGQVPANSPDSDDAAFRIGHLRLQRADYPGSIQAFQACLLKRPNWPEARLNLGIAHWRAGDKEAARTCFQELTASGTDSKEALRGLAALSLEHQEYDKAFAIYRQLLDAGERSPELLYNAGLICQRRGQPEDAAVLYKEALKADPQFGEALLNLGHALMSLGNEFEARSCWRKAVIAKPELAQRYFEPAQAS